MLNKKITFLGVGLLLFAFHPTYAADAVNVNVTVEQQTQSSIDWTAADNEKIIAIGIGRPDARGMAMSRLAAQLDAQRNLLGIVKGVQIDADTLIQDLLVTSDEVRRNISGLLKGAQIVDEGMNTDGGYWVKMSVPLYGAEDSLAAAVLPEVMGDATEPFPEVSDESNVPGAESGGYYSGVVIDADGMGLTPTFSPVIYDTNGRAVYGAKNIDANVAIEKGMVGYADDVFAANQNARVGENPLTVKAVALRGGASPQGTVNVVVSVADADRILAANQQSHMLATCSVMFVR